MEIAFRYRCWFITNSLSVNNSVIVTFLSRLCDIETNICKMVKQDLNTVVQLLSS